MPKVSAYRDPKRREAFDAMLRNGSTIEDAAAVFSVNSDRVRKWLAMDPAFAAAVRELVADARQRPEPSVADLPLVEPKQPARRKLRQAEHHAPDVALNIASDDRVDARPVPAPKAEKPKSAHLKPPHETTRLEDVKPVFGRPALTSEQHGSCELAAPLAVAAPTKPEARLTWDDAIAEANASHGNAPAVESNFRESARVTLAVNVDHNANDNPADARWQRVWQEAAALGEGLFGMLLWVDAHLQTKGFPALSLWWIATVRAFWATGKRWLLLRVGRRGGKSSTLCRVAVVEAIFGGHEIPPGDTGVWPIFSTDQAEADGRITTIKAILDSLGIRYLEKSVRSRKIIACEDAHGKPVEFRVYPATVAAASGFTGIGNNSDEEAKWRDDKSGANPAAEVLKAVRPTMLTMRKAHGYRASSAFAESGTHYNDIEAGSDEIHHVATLGAFLSDATAGFEAVALREKSRKDAQMIRDYAAKLTADSPNIPTWVTNPTQDAPYTRAQEKDLITWLREYGSRSLGIVGVAHFDSLRLLEALKDAPKNDGGPCFAALDTGSKSNACALAIVRRIEIGAMTLYEPVELREWIPSPGAPLDIDRETIPAALELCRKHRCESVLTDAYYGTSVELRAAPLGIAVQYTSSDPFTAYYEPVRRGINRGEVCLGAGAEEAARQLRVVKSAPGDGGKMRILIPYEVSESGTVVHADLGVALVRALAAAGCGELEDEDVSDFFSEFRGGESRYAGVIGSRER